MSTSPQRGDAAPDFTLPGTVGGVRRNYTLSAERGHPVVLVFYPGDETPVCTKQLCSYQHDIATLRDLDATLWGISSQGLDSHEKFQERRGLSFPLLADEDDEVFTSYGLGTGALTNRRAIFVIDVDGTIVWAHVSRLGLTYQTAETIAEVLRAVRPAA